MTGGPNELAMFPVAVKKPVVTTVGLMVMMVVDGLVMMMVVVDVEVNVLTEVNPWHKPMASEYTAVSVTI